MRHGTDRPDDPSDLRRLPLVPSMRSRDGRADDWRKTPSPAFRTSPRAPAPRNKIGASARDLGLSKLHGQSCPGLSLMLHLLVKSTAAIEFAGRSPAGLFKP